jgi:hypothetical protein
VASAAGAFAHVTSGRDVVALSLPAWSQFNLALASPSHTRSHGEELAFVARRLSSSLDLSAKAKSRAESWRPEPAKEYAQEARPADTILFFKWGCCHESSTGVHCSPLRLSSPCRAATWASVCRVYLRHRGLCWAIMGWADVCGDVSIVRYGLFAPIRPDRGSERRREARSRDREFRL